MRMTFPADEAKLQRRKFTALALALGALPVSRPALSDSFFELLKKDVTGDLNDARPEVREQAAYLLGLSSFVYGYPLVVMNLTRKVLTAVSAPFVDGTAAPINQLARMPEYVSPYYTNVVRMSRNSLWTTGFVDLDAEPMVLSVPDTKGRYYVFSVMNMWTDVFMSIGKRTTGTGPGAFLIAGPKWQGSAPAGVKQVFRCSTRYAWLRGQTPANGPSDFAAVNALQAEYKLVPLGAWGRPYTPSTNVPVDSSVALIPSPPEQVANMDAATFFNRLSLAMKDNPPYATDALALRKLTTIGVNPGEPFDIGKVDPAVERGLNHAIEDAVAKMTGDVTSMDNVNGWIQLADIGHYGTDYGTRAGIAMVGLGANMQEDTIYPIAFVDGDGKRLDAANRYVLHYARDGFTPTNATWSVSLYQGPNYAPNIVERYDIAPWMPLMFNPDGSLDIYIQSNSPGGDKEANWLPAPQRGEFNIVIRNYWPKKEALDGTYKNPPIKRVT